MKIKDILRRWLEIPDGSDYVKRSDVINDIRNEVKQVICCAFAPKDEINEMQYDGKYYRILGTLDQAVSRLVNPAAGEAVDKRLAEVVDAEKFLDDIVARLKRKQLDK
jgi:hypothetical protein